MTPKQFDHTAVALFGSALGPHGFSSDKSRFCTFYRKASAEVYHIILPDLGSRGAWYDVKVFPASPVLDPLFESQFPDDLGIPTDNWSYLSDRGIGLDQERFNCMSEENFRRRFNGTVKDLLLKHAIPYLDRIQTVQDILPLIRVRMYHGFALYHLGRKGEAQNILEQEQLRLEQLNSSDASVTVRLNRIREILRGDLSE